MSLQEFVSKKQPVIPSYISISGQEGTSSAFYKCIQVDTTNKTWEGVPLKKVNGIYTITDIPETLSDSETEPVVGSIYNRSVTYKVSLFTKIQ